MCPHVPSKGSNKQRGSHLLNMNTSSTGTDFDIVLGNFLLMGRKRKQHASESSILGLDLQVSDENFLQAYIGFFPYW